VPAAAATVRAHSIVRAPGKGPEVVGREGARVPRSQLFALWIRSIFRFCVVKPMCVCARVLFVYKPSVNSCILDTLKRTAPAARQGKSDAKVSGAKVRVYYICVYVYVYVYVYINK